jgi:glutathione S-transferase
MSITLFQFPISHYCEKARWALDFKGLDYQMKNLLPGMHIKIVRQLAHKTSVPVLDHDGVIVQGSSQIISYLDDTFPERKLTPVNPQEAQQALEWERYLDAEVGVHLRRYVYHTLLEHPKVAIPLLTQGGPWWAKPLFKVTFPKVRKLMRQYMKIDAAGAAESRQRLEAALDRVNEAVAGRHFLVDGAFSRADLTAAALFAPLLMSPKYGLVWPKAMPEPLHSDVARLAGKLAWVESIYNDYR